MGKPASSVLLTALTACLLALGSVACSDDGIDSDEEARRAYLGLDKSIAKSLALGLAGFSVASSANIPAQMASGDGAGTLTITGQVDQGASDNKGLRLRVGMVGYSDGEFPVDMDGKTKIKITYATSMDTTMQPNLQLSLRNVPTGTFTGTLMGSYLMSGAIEGDAVLNLTFSGPLRSNGSGGTERVPGSTTVTGKASTGDGEYTVSLTI
jgi:hypothetical protein